MADYVWKHLPYAVYLDTNALRSAGPSLNKAWISELLSIVNEYGISLCISKLVLMEWCEHIIEVLKNSRQKLLSSISLLKEYEIQVPNIENQEVNLPQQPALFEMVKVKLTNIGFTVIENWDAPLSLLLNEAVGKKPPFEDKGKGLCDAVILESYAKHAKDNFKYPRVLVVSNDAAVRRSEERFKKYKITVDFLSESEIVTKLKSLLKDEIATFREERESRLKDYILKYENMILDQVRKTPLEITDWLLNSPFMKDEDKIHGSIEKILSIKPNRIVEVVGGSPIYGVEIPSDRYPVQIFVELELDIVISDYGFGSLLTTRAVVQPDVMDGSSPIKLNRTFNLEPREFTQTIKRSIPVYATIDAGKEEKDIFDDFRIEKIG